MASEMERLAEAHRDLWIRTMLVITHSEPQRRAFIAGYNGDSRPATCSDRMRQNYKLGQDVYSVLGASQGDAP